MLRSALWRPARACPGTPSMEELLAVVTHPTHHPRYSVRGPQLWLLYAERALPAAGD